MKPPAFPVAPSEYDADKQNVFSRVLTQHLSQQHNDDVAISQKVDVLEVLQWLS